MSPFALYKRDSVRYLRALELRRAGFTLRAIGFELGVSREQARLMIWVGEHIEKQHKRIKEMGDDPELWAVLTDRTFRTLEAYRIITKKTRLSDLRKMEISERWLKKIPGYGINTHEEVKEWASGDRLWRG